MYDNDDFKKENQPDKVDAKILKCMMCGSVDLVLATYQMTHLNPNVTRYHCKSCNDEFSVLKRKT